MATGLDERAAAHLRDDVVVWFTTVTPEGAPLPMPVWFHWDGGDTVVMYSRDTPRLRNIRTRASSRSTARASRASA
jgi:hypothetical protein